MISLSGVTVHCTFRLSIKETKLTIHTPWPLLQAAHVERGGIEWQHALDPGHGLRKVGNEA